MEELFLKSIPHVFEGLILSGLLGLLHFCWKIVRVGMNNNSILKETRDLVEELVVQNKETGLRVDVHDALFSNIYQTSVSSKMILNGTQEIPKFKKSREH